MTSITGALWRPRPRWRPGRRGARTTRWSWAPAARRRWSPTPRGSGRGRAARHSGRWCRGGAHPRSTDRRRASGGLPMSDPRQPAYESLDPEARALVSRWVAELAREPAETATMFRFLVAMAAVRLGELREVRRLVRDGK